ALRRRLYSPIPPFSASVRFRLQGFRRDSAPTASRGSRTVEQICNPYPARKPSFSVDAQRSSSDTYNTGNVSSHEGLAPCHLQRFAQEENPVAKLSLRESHQVLCFHKILVGKRFALPSTEAFVMKLKIFGLVAVLTALFVAGPCGSARANSFSFTFLTTSAQTLASGTLTTGGPFVNGAATLTGITGNFQGFSITGLLPNNTGG